MTTGIYKTCRRCGEALSGVVSFDPCPPDPAKPSYLHQACARQVKEEGEAKAILLSAAAPKLLDALEELAGEIERSPALAILFRIELNAAKNAIAAARGEPTP